MRKGIKVEFANGDLELFPLTLGQLRDLCEDISMLRATSIEDVLKPEGSLRLARVLAAAARTTDEEVLRCVDLEDMVNGSVNKAIQALMGMTGLKPRKTVDQDAFRTPPLNGGTSTHDSAQLRDGQSKPSTN